MVAPLVVGAYMLGTAVVAGVSSYLAGDKIINQQQSTTQYLTQIKNNEVIIGSNSKIGELTIKDSLVANQTATQEQTATQQDDLMKLLLVGGAGFVAYKLAGGKK